MSKALEMFLLSQAPVLKLCCKAGAQKIGVDSSEMLGESLPKPL